VGLSRVLSKLTRDYVKRLYDNYWQNVVRKDFLSLLESNSRASLLDLGCHDGKFTLQIAQTIGTKDIHGIELSESLVQEAIRGGRSTYSRFERPISLS